MQDPREYPGGFSQLSAKTAITTAVGASLWPGAATPYETISEVMKSLGRDADRAGALLITVDPERDTPATLKDYLSNFDPHLRGLTGDPAAVDAALKAYRVYAKKIPIKDGDYTMDHTAAVYLMDKDGQFVALFDLQQTPEAAADQLRGYL
jgi:protein SCO1/2